MKVLLTILLALIIIFIVPLQWIALAFLIALIIKALD
jgi:hypothetical protein